MDPQFWQGVAAASVGWIVLSIVSGAALAWLLRSVLLEHELDGDLGVCETPQAPTTPGAGRNSRRKAA